jgi:hypothetical protein
VERHCAEVQAVSPQSTPLPDGAKLEMNSPKVGVTSFAQAICSLLYLSACSKPDISVAVRKLARFTQAPTQWQWTCLQDVLRYLAGTVGYGLKYGSRGGLECYVDASYAPEGKRSTTGWG